MKSAHILKKLQTCLALAVIGLACLGFANSQTIEWGSEAFSDFQQSNGDPLDNTFVFELGTFQSGFVPLESNAADWFANWKVFDTAVFVPATGSFSSSADMNPAGGSASPTGDPAFNFAGLQAYMWIRNEDTPGPTTEWFLAADPSWIYPTALPAEDCCNNGVPLQWVINDVVEPDEPIVTVSPIPEPGTGLLTLLAAATALLRRKRA